MLQEDEYELWKELEDGERTDRLRTSPLAGCSCEVSSLPVFLPGRDCVCASGGGAEVGAAGLWWLSAAVCSTTVWMADARSRMWLTAAVQLDEWSAARYG